jgi:hypothetical protein
MWHYPKSRLHQVVIDAAKAERDLEVGRSMAAQAKPRLQREALQTVIERQADKLAILAKTERLRADRLAREAEAKTTAPVKFVRGSGHLGPR